MADREEEQRAAHPPPGGKVWDEGSALGPADKMQGAPHLEAALWDGESGLTPRIPCACSHLGDRQAG